MKTTHQTAARILGVAGMALSLAFAGPARAEVRLDPNRDDSKGFKFLTTGDVPYIDFTTLDGEVLTNESLKGKLVVIDVWATWCAPCMAAMPHFESLVKEYGGNDKIEFLGVSLDTDRETLDNTIKERGISWTQVYDEGRNLNKAWNQGMIPTIVILAPTGESVYVGHPMNMDAPLQEALKKYVPEAYSAEKHEAALAKAAEAEKARQAEMEKRRIAAEAQAAAAYKPGSFPLGELNLVDIDGKPITAESLSGKVVIMDFWATWCGPCMASMPHMKELYAKHHEADGVEVIGMSRDRDEATLRKTKDEVGMPWLHVYDEDGSISKKFNVTGIPQIFIFSRTGEMLWAGHPMSMDEPLAKVLADDGITSAAFAKKDDGERKSVPMMGKTQAMKAAKTTDGEAPKMVAAAAIKPMPAPAQPQEPRIPLEIGAKPEFTLSFVDGKQVTNEDLKGKIVVMDFWATWCGPCMAAMPHMVELQKEYGDKGIQIVGISLDKSMDTLKQTLADKPDMSWPQHYDPDRVITKQFGVSGIPTIYILSPEGEVLWHGHPNEMVAPLKQAMADYPTAVAKAD
jgi:thiol-disulfide isomerase/thioredoxin